MSHNLYDFRSLEGSAWITKDELQNKFVEELTDSEVTYMLHLHCSMMILCFIVYNKSMEPLYNTFRRPLKKYVLKRIEQ